MFKGFSAKTPRVFKVRVLEVKRKLIVTPGNWFAHLKPREIIRYFTEGRIQNQNRSDESESNSELFRIRQYLDSNWKPPHPKHSAQKALKRPASCRSTEEAFIPAQFQKTRQPDEPDVVKLSDICMALIVQQQCHGQTPFAEYQAALRIADPPGVVGKRQSMLKVSDLRNLL